MYWCAETHNTMSELTGNANKTSEQHCEPGNTRIAWNVKDLQIIHCWVTANYPFSEKTELMCISTCLTAPINCDRANVIGAKVQQSLHNQTWTSVKEPPKEKIATLATLHSTLKIDNEVDTILPTHFASWTWKGYNSMFWIWAYKLPASTLQGWYDEEW